MSLEELPVISGDLLKKLNSEIKSRSLDIKDMENYLAKNNTNLYNLIEKCCELNQDPLNSKFMIYTVLKVINEQLSSGRYSKSKH